MDNMLQFQVVNFYIISLKFCYFVMSLLWSLCVTLTLTDVDNPRPWETDTDWPIVGVISLGFVKKEIMGCFLYHVSQRALTGGWGGGNHPEFSVLLDKLSKYMA